MPGGNICSIATCKSNSKKNKETDEEKLIFFSFPKNLVILNEWVRKCCRKDKWTLVNKRICSRRFKKDDYEDELQARLMNIQPRKLKKDDKDFLIKIVLKYF